METLRLEQWVTCGSCNLFEIESIDKAKELDEIKEREEESNIIKNTNTNQPTPHQLPLLHFIQS